MKLIDSMIQSGSRLALGLMSLDEWECYCISVEARIHWAWQLLEYGRPTHNI